MPHLSPMEWMLMLPSLWVLLISILMKTHYTTTNKLMTKNNSMLFKKTYWLWYSSHYNYKL